MGHHKIDFAQRTGKRRSTFDTRHHEYCVERREGEEVGVQRDEEGIQKGHHEDACRNTRDGGLKRDREVSQSTEYGKNGSEEWQEGAE